MTATPADVARYTSDGVLLTNQDATIKDAFPNAADTGDREIEMFFDVADDGQTMLDELFAFVAKIGRPHEAIAIADSLGLGSIIPVFPRAPQVHVTDESRSLDTAAVIRAYSFDMAADSYALELVGVDRQGYPPGTISFDSTNVKFDSTAAKWDNGV